MKKYTILISTILLITVGYLIEDRGLAIQMTSDGQVLYPISSGSEDGIVLKSGLYLFVFTALYSVISIFKKHKDSTLFVVYASNSLFFTFFLLLALMDSSIIEAAKLGDWLPLTANIIWLMSFLIYGALSLNNASQPTPKSGAAEL